MAPVSFASARRDDDLVLLPVLGAKLPHFFAAEGRMSHPGRAVERGRAARIGMRHHELGSADDDLGLPAEAPRDVPGIA